MDLTISEMMEMQQKLYVLNRDKWPEMEPENGEKFILYMIEEIGETIAILKKKGNREVVEDSCVREAFLEEMADVLMYYHEVLLRYHVTPEEISDAYRKKHEQNLGRNYSREYKELYHNG